MTDPIPDDLHEQFIRLFASCEGRVRAVLRALLPSLNALDDVMQETALAAWRKFREFEAGTSFFAWMVTIGRFEALRWRRDHAAARLVFCDQLADLLADEAVAESEEQEAKQSALARCLEKLPPRQRGLLMIAYQSGVRARDVAERAGMSVEAFYKMIQRLRVALLQCVQKEANAAGAP